MDSEAGPPAGELDEDVRWPPRRWPRLYAIVLGTLVVEIALLWILARTFQ
jgi:hypothetical protein